MKISAELLCSILPQGASRQEPTIDVSDVTEVVDSGNVDQTHDNCD